MKIFINLFLILLFAPPIHLLGEYAFNSKKVCKKRAYRKKCISQYFKQYWSLGKDFKDLSYKINRHILGKNIISNIHFGKEGYLFYASPTDGDPLGDLRGKPLTKNQQERIINYYDKVFSEHYGINAPYFNVLMPNKSRVLKQYTDLGIYTFPPAPYQAVTPKLNLKHKRRFVGPDEVMAIKFWDRMSYPKTDTHWSLFGAYKFYSWMVHHDWKGYNLPLRISHEEFRFRPYDMKQKKLPLDILKMLELKDPGSLVKTEFPEPFIKDSCVEVIKDKLMYQHFKCKKAANVALVIGDSYRLKFARMLAESFGEVISVHIEHLHKLKDYIKDKKIYYIFEITVERYLKRK